MALAQAKKLDIAQAYSSGRPLKIIAHTFGVAEKTVRRIAVGAGIKPRAVGRAPAPRTIDDNAVLMLFKGGLDTISAAARLRIKPHDAANALARARDAEKAR